MVTYEEVFSEENLRNAMQDILMKRDSCGIDGIRISQFEEYWKINKIEILDLIEQCEYVPCTVQNVEIVMKSGKKRIISKYSTVDRFILRAIVDRLQREIEPVFSKNSYAYQEGKGVVRAVSKVADYIEAGNVCVAEIDIEHYFDNVILEHVEFLLKEYVDEKLFKLIKKYLYNQVESCGRLQRKVKGLIQGSPLSPLLSNLYLNELDYALERKGYSFVRFSDDINLYAVDEETASAQFIDVEEMLLQLGLHINKQKSGIYKALGRTYLGQEFWLDEQSKRVFARRKQEQKRAYGNWNKSIIQKVDRNYHILQDGILSKSDYTVLFENESGKEYLPVETMSGLNIYSNVIFTSEFFQFVHKKRLRVALFDKYGRSVGSVVTEKYGASGKTMLKQAELYNDISRRLLLAKSLIIASEKSMRANLRYYYKVNHENNLGNSIEKLSQIIVQMNETPDIGNLMLIEARGHQIYYKAFNSIIKHEEFLFEQRSKRPPKDAINALISFGNVFLYNRIATEIHKTSLDIRIGILHATNNRAESLNLDIAELFKPIIVDRAIFTLINKNMITVNEHFELTEEGSTYLNKEGKRLFIQMLEEKLYQKVKYKQNYVSYDNLIRKEIQKILRCILYQEKYKPYSYVL